MDAFYTDDFIVEKISEFFPEFPEKDLKILEPSVGEGAFLPKIFEKYSNKNLSLDAVDIDEKVLKNLKKKYKNIRTLNEDFLEHNFGKHYDLVVGNPPFKNAREFLEKSLRISDYVILILPKTFLSSEKFRRTREFIENFRIEKIIDLKEEGFLNVKIETICIFINLKKESDEKQKYFTDKKFPYWLIYRDKNFDKMAEKMQFGIFKAYRDRDLKNEVLGEKNSEKNIFVLRSKNISKTGLVHIDGYDKYISKKDLEGSKAIKYLNREVYVVPNLSDKIRIFKKPKNVVCNGSVAMLVPENGVELSRKDLEFLSSNEFEKFYDIATNKSTRSKNIDKNSIFFFGKPTS